jgi:hypothetical protein
MSLHCTKYAIHRSKKQINNATGLEVTTEILISDFYNSHIIYTKCRLMFYDRNLSHHVIEAKQHRIFVLHLHPDTRTWNTHDQ